MIYHFKIIFHHIVCGGDRKGKENLKVVPKIHVKYSKLSHNKTTAYDGLQGQEHP